MNSQDLALACARAASSKKAEDIRILDLRDISSFADFFVVCSGTSEPHLKAVAAEIRERLREDHGIRAVSDGLPASQWVVLDYGSVLVHVFQPAKRQYYNLEGLWRDAPVQVYEDDPPAAGVVKQEIPRE